MPKFARCGSGYGIIAIQSICISIPVESVVRSVFKAHSSSRCIRQIYPTALVRIVEFVIYGIEKRNVDPVIGQDMTAILSGSQQEAVGATAAGTTTEGSSSCSMQHAALRLEC